VIAERPALPGKLPVTEPGTCSTPTEANQPFGQRVREIVVTGLVDGGAPDIREVASRVSTSARTLQRRLRGAGLSYAGLVQQARCEAASRMLLESDQSVSDVARTLGYSDPAHFTRAFHRWTGLTPREFRRRRDGGPDAP
jgi:AraC-like DNA-binding protein